MGTWTSSEPSPLRGVWSSQTPALWGLGPDALCRESQDHASPTLVHLTAGWSTPGTPGELRHCPSLGPTPSCPMVPGTTGHLERDAQSRHRAGTAADGRVSERVPSAVGDAETWTVGTTQAH